MKLIIENVSKRYANNLWGLQNFSLILERGVLALLGPNGAGKSTLMRILATTGNGVSSISAYFFLAAIGLLGLAILGRWRQER